MRIYEATNILTVDNWSVAIFGQQLFPGGSTNMAAKKVVQNIRLLKVRPLIDLRVRYFSKVSVKKYIFPWTSEINI